MIRDQFIKQVNKFAAGHVPFLFIIDFEMLQFELFRAEEAAASGVFYTIRGATNLPAEGNPVPSGFTFDADPIPFSRYQQAFDLVRKNIIHGNTFLLNLTFPTPIRTSLSMEEIFRMSVAPYRLLFRDQFVVFSPECFIRIHEDQIYSYPMKGTIDAATPDAEKVLMNNKKEQWEHHTIVDLIRNDLSMVSEDVNVSRFRYVDRIQTHRHQLLQVSSEIRGRFRTDWRASLGNILTAMLPAGSISGAPKHKTVDIIREAEPESRGFFTGIFGVFDGESLDSAVMIRFIERTPEGLRFRSGGGITGSSDPESEYREMIDKVYVPIV
jgi:para-aminobenzoate synthetase component 1